MDGILQFGPLMIATDRALAVALLWGFVALGGIIAARTHSNAGRTSWLALLVGILAARVGFVTANYSAFMAEPLTVFAFWQGGFSPWLGVAAAAFVVLVKLGRTRPGIALLGTLGALALIYGGTAMLLAPEPRPLPSNLSLRNLDGSWTNIDDARGQPMVINLWATWCPPCRREMPMVIDVAASSTVPVLLANQGETVEQVRAYLAREGLADDAILLDPRGSLGAATGSAALPTTLFIDGAGQIRKVHAGEISRAALTAAIRDLERNP